MPARMTINPTNTNAPIKKRLLSTLLFFLLFLFAAGGSLNAVRASDKLPATAFIAIIIDDLGYKKKHDMRAIQLPGNVTYAFLPHTPYIKDMAVSVHEQGHEIMLHLPMQSTEPFFLGPGALTNDMTEQEFKQLPRVGPAIAKRIITYREMNGLFKSNDDLKKVKGIGPKTFEKIKPYLQKIE